MALKVQGKDNVIVAAKKRMRLVAKNNSRIYVSFSGGKDSLSLAGIIEELVDAGDIDPRAIEFVFVDEEAVYPDVIKIVEQWRKKVMLWGGKFHWLCLPVRHYNCFNELENDMSFICWDPRKEDVWCRQPPSFAIRSHPSFKWGMTYQAFLTQKKDGMDVIGLRAAESLQRLNAIMRRKGEARTAYPIYDWSDSDVWHYLQDRDMEFPEAYLLMYRGGISASRLRLSQFFSIDTAYSLVHMMEFYPEVYQAILRREPNAYLAMHYWDSEMFRRSSSTKNELEGATVYDRNTVMAKLPEFMKKNPKQGQTVKRFIIQYGPFATEKTWKSLSQIMVAGDPKGRIQRTLYYTLKKGKDV